MPIQLSLLGIYLLLANVIAFIAYGIDKRRAKRGNSRISERRLLLVAALGGSLGAYSAMRLMHHKTQHLKFRFGIPTLLVLHVALAVWVALL